MEQFITAANGILWSLPMSFGILLLGLYLSLIHI